jgi:hypothetical protein
MRRNMRLMRVADLAKAEGDLLRQDFREAAAMRRRRTARVVQLLERS